VRYFAANRFRQPDAFLIQVNGDIHIMLKIKSFSSADHFGFATTFPKDSPKGVDNRHQSGIAGRAHAAHNFSKY